MNSPIPIYARVLIGLVVVAAVGAGVWGGIVATRHNNSKSEASKTISPVVLNALNQLSPTPTASSSPSSSSAAISTPQPTATSKPAPKPTKNTEVKLTASVSIATAGNIVSISVVANQPVVIGLAPLSGKFSDSDYSNVKTLNIQTSVSNDLIIRTKNGQEMTYSLSATSNGNGNNLNLNSATSSTSTNVTISNN